MLLPRRQCSWHPSERGWFITMVTDARNITFCNQHTQRSFKESVKIRALSTISENCQRARRLHSHNAAFRAAKWGGGGGLGWGGMHHGCISQSGWKQMRLSCSGREQKAPPTSISVQICYQSHGQSKKKAWLVISEWSSYLNPQSVYVKL